MFGLFESKNEKRQKLLNKGCIALKGGQFRSAESCFLKVIEIGIMSGGMSDEISGEAWAYLGGVQFAVGNFRKAKDCYESSLNCDGNKSTKYLATRGMAISEKYLGNDEHAVELFRELEEKFDYKPDDDPTIPATDRMWMRENGL